jgi:uncharacterized protein (DUF2141 family)
MKGVVLALLIAPVVLVAQTPRDVSAPAPTGTGVIAGSVVSDDSSAVPVRRAVVIATSPDLRGDRRTVTDDQGRFAIGQLPPGRYTLSATKAGWITTYFGSSHPGRPAFGGAAVAIKAGEHAPPVALKLLHGSAITGVIRDAFGRPASGVELQLATMRMQDGERRLVTENVGPLAGNTSTTSDDRGTYRLFGVAPGDYLVIASPGFGAFGNAEVLQSTPEDLAAARRSLATSTPGGAPGSVSNVAAQNAARPLTVASASVFYPGTVDLQAATVLHIGPNEERAGIDFTMQLVPTARVEGIVLGLDGQPTPNAAVRLTPPFGDVFFFGSNYSARTGPDGHFRILGVDPGGYEIVARAADQTAGAAGRGGGGAMSITINGGVITTFSGPGPNAALFAADRLTVAGSDISGVTLTLQHGATISGHVVFSPSSLQVPDLSRTRVNLTPLPGAADIGMGSVSGAQSDATGAFQIVNVPPGRYRVNANIAPAGRAGGAGRGGGGAGVGPGASVVPVAPWQLRSAMSGDVDAIDHPIDVTLNAGPPELVVTFADHLGEIGGAVRNAAGQPVTDYRIVVFSADKTLWGMTNRRMRAPVQTERDGTFRVENLPAGSYFLAAVTDMEPDDLASVAFLEDLAAHAIPIALAEGEKKQQEIRVR